MVSLSPVGRACPASATGGIIHQIADRGRALEAGPLAFAAGVLAAQQLRALPDPLWVSLLPVALLLAWRARETRLPALATAGFLWAVLHGHLHLLERLPEGLEGCDVELSGQVVGVPARERWRVRFELIVERARRARCPAGLEALPVAPGARLRLSWYRTDRTPRSGERWRMTARLRAPRGFANPGGFDYERYLYRRGIAATGYLRSDAAARRIAPAGASLDGLRERLASRVRAALAGRPAGRIVPALVLGVRDGLDGEHRALLQATGTAHLFAISGLHIGLVAGFVLLAVRAFWARWPALARRLAAPRAGAVAGLAAALLYAGLAGFALPTVRALVMLAMLLGARIALRATAPGTGLGRALAVVLALDPEAPLGAGFWLSFSAVAALLLLHGARPQAMRRRRWWRQGLVTQLWMGLAMAPVLLHLYGRVPLLAPLANALAIPWVGVVVVPVLLLGTLLLIPFPAAGTALLHLGATALDLLWPLLSTLAGWDPGWGAVGAPGALAIGTAVIALALIAAPPATPGRRLALALLAPALLGAARRPPPGGFELMVLDVGQGLAAVVRTRNHLLVYDAGPRYRSGFDAGAAVLVPYLRRLGARRIDVLVLSHRDRDHRGGAESLRRALPVETTVAGDPEAGERRCLAGQRWRWDGVVLEVLHPRAGERWSGNDRSCVLRVAGPGGAVLLTGDLELDGEQALVARLGAALHAAVLVVPHHGSATSSGAALLDAVRPHHALLSRGYRNRFALPAASVIARYRARGVAIHDTALDGALRVSAFPARGIEIGPGERRRRRRYWSAR